MAAIVSAFPGMGKTYLTLGLGPEKLKTLKFKDSDSSEFSWIKDANGNKVRNPDFPKNYIEYIKSIQDKYDIIFVLSHKSVRAALNEAGLSFFCVVPPKSYGADRYVNDRIKNRKTGINNDDFCEIIRSNWDNWLDEIEQEDRDHLYPNMILAKNTDLVEFFSLVICCAGISV